MHINRQDLKNEKKKKEEIGSNNIAGRVLLAKNEKLKPRKLVNFVLQ